MENKKKKVESIDIEIKKLELEAKYGARFVNVEDLPKEVEMEWLNYIEKFEEEYNKNENKKVD